MLVVWVASVAAAPEHVVVQYGVTRTATTVQFQALCAISCLTSSDPRRVYCGNCQPDVLEGYDRLVCKTHSLNQAKTTMKRFPGARLFATGCNGSTVGEPSAEYAWRATARTLEETWNMSIAYLQVVELLERRGHFMLRDYARFFDIAEDRLDALVAYMRYWDSLRRCCDGQMSTDYKARLTGYPLGYVPRQSQQSPAYDACETLNLPELERLLVKTEVYAACARHVPQLAALKAPPLNSRVDRVILSKPVLDGTHCAHANDDIKAKVLKKHAGHANISSPNIHTAGAATNIKLSGCDNFDRRFNSKDASAFL